jgi:pimeloyl-ACP methyl ester carboxylesterase
MSIRSIVDSYFHTREERAAQVDEEFKNAGQFTLCSDQAIARPPFQTLAELQNWVEYNKANGDEFFTIKDNTNTFMQRKNEIVFRSSDATGCPGELVSLRFFGGSFPVGKTVVIVPHWNAQFDGYDVIAKLLAILGYGVCVLTLPHHGPRNAAPNSRVANGFLNADLFATVMAVQQSVGEVRRLVNWLHAKGAKEIHVIGVSLGSCVASIASAFEPKISSASLLLTAGDFSEVVWTGRATQHIRKQFEGQIDLPQLRKIWSIISPSSYLKDFARAAVPLFLISGRRDEVVRFDISGRFVDELRQSGVKVKWKIMPCGHYTLSEFPFSWMALAMIVNFLRQSSKRPMNARHQTNAV